MRKIGKRMMAGILAATMTVGLFGVPGFGTVSEAAEIPVRETTTTEAGTNTILVGVEGMDYTSATQEIIDQINQVRKEACEDGNVPDPRDKTRMLTSSDYVEIKAGKNCQSASMIRAAEAAVLLAHTRPNGKSCSTVGSYFGVSCAENLQWDNPNTTSMVGWIDEKDDWVNQNSGAVTGHYTSLINPNYRYVGISTFNPANDSIVYGSYKPNWACTAGEFASADTALTTFEEVKSDR